MRFIKNELDCKTQDLDCDNPRYQRGYCDGQAYVIETCRQYLKEDELPHERMERDHRDALALMRLLAAEKLKNEAHQRTSSSALLRAADMLTAYIELIRRDGASNIEQHHYIPEVEFVVSELREMSK